MLHACFTPIALCFVHTSWHFYAFSKTNLLTRCHSASSYFLLFLCFRKVTQEIFSELDKTKAKVPIFPEASQSPKQRRRSARRRPHHPMEWTTPWPRWGVVWAPGPPPDTTLPPIYSPRRDNLKDPINWMKYSRNWMKQKPKFLFTRHEDGVQRRDGEGPGGSCTIWWHGPPLAMPLGGVGPWSTF
jgi:hypothetical protein